MPEMFVAEVVWSQHFVEVRWFVAVFQKWPNLPALKTCFLLFFSKCCHLEHNKDNHMKPTPDVNYFPKFL
jgi:hypothetical protein